MQTPSIDWIIQIAALVVGSLGLLVGAGALFKVRQERKAAFEREAEGYRELERNVKSQLEK